MRDDCSKERACFKGLSVRFFLGDRALKASMFDSCSSWDAIVSDPFITLPHAPGITFLGGIKTRVFASVVLNLALLEAEVFLPPWAVWLRDILTAKFFLSGLLSRSLLRALLNSATSSSFSLCPLSIESLLYWSGTFSWREGKMVIISCFGYSTCGMLSFLSLHRGSKSSRWTFYFS